MQLRICPIWTVFKDILNLNQKKDYHNSMVHPIRIYKQIHIDERSKTELQDKMDRTELNEDVSHSIE